VEINVPTIVWAIVNFLILAGILGKFLFKPVITVLDERAELVKTNIEEAEKDKATAASLKEEYASQLQKAQVEAQQIVARAKKAAEETKTQIVEEAKDNAAKIKEKASKEIEEEKQAAILELKGEVSTLSVMLAEKIIGRSLNPDDHKKLVNDFIEEVGELH
jgi:F-type H+-transporting ATPase subunit b